MIVSIQYLRALASVLVLFWHVRIKSEQVGGDVFHWLFFGYIGVDIFFVISGFIMTFLLLNTRMREKGWGSFVADRCTRILPVYWLLTAVACLAYFVVPKMVNSGGGETSVWRSFLLIPSVYKFLLQNGWTLTYEFVFYAIFSIVFLFKKKELALFVAFGLSLIVSTLGWLIYGVSVFWNFLFLLEFSSGIFVAWLMQHYRNRAFPQFVSLLFIGLGVGSILCSGADFVDQVYLLPNLVGVGSAFLVAGFLGFEDKIKARQSKILLLLGNSSYSMYLTHPFILSAFGFLFRHFFHHRIFLLELIYWIFAGLVAIVFGHIFSVLVEVRVIRYAKQIHAVILSRLKYL